MDKRTLAMFAALGATLIYALNHTIAKDVMPTYIKGFGFIGIRLIGATIAFWLIGLLMPKKHIDKADRSAFLRAAFFGMAINMLAFFKGLEYSTPINSTVIITTTPIMVFLFSVILLKENIRPKRAIGVLIGFLGALSLVLFSQQAPANAPNISLGNFLFIANASTYGLYMIYVKPLSEKYNTIHLLKWLFLIGLLMTMPFTLPELLEVDFQLMPHSVWWRIGFVVLGTTFMTYLLMVYAIRHLRATSLSVFTYLQPIIGIVYAALVGADFMTPVKWIAMSLVLLGVFLVTKQEQPKGL
ncbi:MAG: DMT family transporter [Bacteroidota bacterium]|nr:DMT family transporter [Bacteroidota bacterium]